jgi:hypothetical protein
MEIDPMGNRNSERLRMQANADAAWSLTPRGCFDLPMEVADEARQRADPAAPNLYQGLLGALEQMVEEAATKTRYEHNAGKTITEGECVRMMMRLVCAVALNEEMAPALALQGNTWLMERFGQPFLHLRQAARERMYGDQYPARAARRHHH